MLTDDLLTSGRIEVIPPEDALPTVALKMLIVRSSAGIVRVRRLVGFLVGKVGRSAG